MQCSLYGKVPAKRDFIAIGAPREFLNAWEPWLQGAISASRTALGERWQPAFLTAPIWRFWLGADICGRSVIGAFMSSLDGVGRYFPLTLFACADDNAAIPPPELGSQDDWFDTVEAFLMSTLDHDANFEAMTAELGALPPPSGEVPQAPAPDTGCDRNGFLALPTHGQSLANFLVRFVYTIMPRFTPVRHFGGPSAAKASHRSHSRAGACRTRSCFRRC